VSGQLKTAAAGPLRQKQSTLLPQQVKHAMICSAALQAWYHLRVSVRVPSAVQVFLYNCVPPGMLASQIVNVREMFWKRPEQHG
jgi:hypothetical protein